MGKPEVLVDKVAKGKAGMEARTGAPEAMGETEQTVATLGLAVTVALLPLHTKSIARTENSRSLLLAARLVPLVTAETRAQLV